MLEEQASELSIEQSLDNLAIEQPNEDLDLEHELLNHVLLPRFLPQTKRPELYEHELELLSRIWNIVADQDEWIPTNTVEMLRNLYQVHLDCLPETIFKHINALKPGGTFAMFIKGQNCMLIIYMPPTKEKPSDSTPVIIATYPGNLDAKDINRNIGDFEFNYPVQALKVKFSKLLRSIEFSKQLFHVHEMLNPASNLVSGWLVQVLCDEDVQTATPHEFPPLTKKLRDEICGKNTQTAFRRSAFYMCVKSLLQHSLTIELGTDMGKVLYKTIMLQFITQMCNAFKTSNCKTHDISLMYQIMAKLGRRIEKLSKLTKLDDDLSDEIKEMKVSASHGAKATIMAIRRKIDAQIDKLQSDDEKNAHLPALNDLNFKEDVIQKVPKLKAYLDERNKMRNEETANENYPKRSSKYVRHDFEMFNAPPTHYFEKCNDSIQAQIRLFDFENWALYQLHSDDDIDVTSIRNLSFSYASVAERIYKNDQLGKSKMILVRLKLLQILDGIACKKHPMLKKHRSGINPNIIKTLLLPQRMDMEVAGALESYFEMRNNASGPSLIEEKKITIASFSSIYAAQDEEMQDLRNQILAETTRKIENLEKKWTEERKKVQRLRSQMVGMQHHKTFTKKNRYMCQNCELCNLKKQVKKTKLQQYEKPLPEDEFKQNAVIFELRIPAEIGHLRDVLHHFVEYCSEKSGEKVNIKENWIKCQQLSEYKAMGDFNVHLGSTTFKKLGLLHVDKPFEAFALLNEYNCVFHVSNAPMPDSIADNSIKNECTLKVEKETGFEGLQWMINSTSHTENEVLACQSKCPDGLSLAEYKNFGCLRADGHRLHLHKLYTMIATEALPFEEPSVLSLIMQSLWELEEKGESSFIRESHDELHHTRFALLMIKLLNEFIEHQKDNWVHPLKLLMAIFISVRINEEELVANETATLLDKLRNIAMDWIKKIQEAICDLRNPDQAIERELRMKLVLVAIAGAVTFSAHPTNKFYQKILQKSTYNEYSAFRIWLEFIITLNNNIRLSETESTDLILNMPLFLRLVLRTGIQLEPSMRELINNNVIEMFKVIKKQWNCDDEKTFETSYFDEVCPQLWCADINEKVIEIDIVTGAFSVNNLPVARLPRKISEDSLYQRVFQTFTFEIQPKDANTFTTVQKYNNRSYKFGMKNEGIIVITEDYIDEDDGGIELELLPTNVLKDELPYLLVENYSHWWCADKNVIYFRPKSFDDKNFSTENGIEYKLNLNNSRLLHLKTQQCLLDVTSKSYSNIIKQLSRLESSNFINILLDKAEPEIALIEMTRMNLKFKVNISKSRASDIESYDIVSNEFSQMRVSLQQKCGTLYGLNHGLLLESVGENSSPFNLLLMPNGNINIKRTTEHVTVNIDTTTDLYNPPFHLYRIDNTCRQLKAINNSYSAWLYLAYLHAVTSHGEIEPLTGISGTESALYILQSGFVWSSAPYDEESIQLLKLFAELSPKRKIGNIPQMVQWPDFIPPHAAQDSYIFIAQKLLKDSQRLHGLYFVSDISTDMNTDLELNRRDYLRHSQLSPNLCVSDIYIQRESIRTSLPKIPSTEYSSNTREISGLYHKRGYNVPSNWSLWDFLTCNKKTLDGLIHFNDLGGILNHCNIGNLANFWISLYEAARHDGIFNSEEFALIWSLLSHKNEPIESLLILQAIENNKEAFSEIDPPEDDVFDLSEGLYDKLVISAILEKGFSTNHYSKVEKNEEVKKIIEQIDAVWPIDQFDFYEGNFTYSFFDLYESMEQIKFKLMHWYNNQKLKEFVEQVESKLRSLVSSMSVVQIQTLPDYNTPIAKQWSKYEVNFEFKMKKIPTKFIREIDEARKVWDMEETSNKSSKQWWKIYESILNKQIEKYFVDARMHPRSIPNLVLPKITSQDIDSRLKVVIGALAIAIAKEQRDERIKALEHQPDLKPTLDRENENEPYQNWKPCEYPEWLLFEIEQNLTIRRIQIEISKRMINPPECATKHSTMQLNMGEGKTAVIVPILASVLADGKQACQVTVLKSLFATNLKALRQYLGGLLNRRIYIFPCRRDMPINDHIDEIQRIYDECKQFKGVIISLPEHQLSFQLKMYESIQKNKSEEAQKFLSMQNWLNVNIRSILDESDAILQPKYQLVYTVGNQLPLDGGIQRWLVMQAVLKRVPYHMKHFYKMYGSDVIEFDEKYLKNSQVVGSTNIDYRPDIFTPCRILKESIYEELKKAIVDDLFADKLDMTLPEMNTETQSNIMNFLSRNTDLTFETICKDLSKDVQNIILILSGLLQFDVMKLLLMKRWRVNYGINKKGPRKMAVPFRAKDVAADMTEFGHPDVAIGYTQLSYYYSGLTDAQLLNCFKILAVTQDSIETYEKFIQCTPRDLIDLSIASYTSVNLSDLKQRNELLFPLLRFNMYVIDFWLSRVVYPHEAKTFENKLMCTAWDLCNENMKYRVTGFSGTNDTKNILPMPISQNDLDELENTNENVRNILLREENQKYEHLPANTSAKDILKRYLARFNIPVLLDSGALMLELNNKQVAEEWLKLTEQHLYEAAVYFDSQDVLQTIDRNGAIAEFDCSIYRENLDRCLVYLDDTHTRGTDLKFPSNRKACVTLSGEITRDKTVQACMRMRQLGNGHSIEFLASFEADLRIREVCKVSRDQPINNENVINFICHNSKTFELENSVHWVAAAHNYTKKLAAHQLYESSNQLLDLYKGCGDTEFVTLREMYSDRKEQPLSTICLAKFNKLYQTYASDRIKKHIKEKYAVIENKLTGPAANLKRFVYVLCDKEQEKEIVYEPETQRQIERPPVVEAAVQSFNDCLTKLILNGLNNETIAIARCMLLSMENGLQKTKLFEDYAKDGLAWADHIKITSNFSNVIQSSTQACDDFLRPVWWIARIDAQNDDYILILLTSFECNRLLPAFRESTKSTLYMFRPRLSKLHNDLLDVVDLRITGKTNTVDLNINDSAQIKMYSGSMYFKNEAEQNAYCQFLGLIPRPRTREVELAFQQGFIKPNGFVPPEYRRKSATIKHVGQCKFQRNPVNLAKKLIEAHHEFMRKESHAAFILERGTKEHNTF